MNLKAYYQKIRDFEKDLTGEFMVVVSLETPEGGKPDRRTEVHRSLAARMIVDGRARLATEEEAEGFRAHLAEARRIVELAEGASRLQVTVVTEKDRGAFKDARKDPGKDPGKPTA